MAKFGRIEYVALPVLTEYSTPGSFTYDIPTWARSLEIGCVGGGGSGGAGRRGVTNAARSGGSGGGGSGISYNRITTLDWGSNTTLTIDVAAGGAAVAGQTVDNTNGANGISGGTSQFILGGSVILRATGGSGGNGGSTTALAGGIGGSGLFGGSNGGGSVISGASGAGNNSLHGAGAGGAGGSITAANAIIVPATGGVASIAMRPNLSPTSAGNSGSVNGSNAAILNIVRIAGNGGGGGYGTGAAIGGNGGNGFRGGGGGGGGFSDNGFTSGGGGKGGDGYCYIIAHPTY